MKLRSLFTVICLLAMTSISNAQDLLKLVDYLKGAKIIAQDDKNTYLGKLSNFRFASKCRWTQMLDAFYWKIL